MTLVRWLAVAWFALVGGACALPGPTPIANPPAQPLVDCVGVPPDVCQGAVRDAGLNAPPGTVIVRLQIRCTVQVCLPASGQTQIDVQYSDGTTTTFGNAWEQAVPGEQGPPVLPVQPTCVGVPLERCRETALGAVPVGEDRPAVLSIVVTCTKPPCTASVGDGDTVVTYADRSTSESSWSYRN
ncbi:MAG: hypothetical protein ACSLFN_06030 [Candidatus Limnocylindrales bacterium]